MFRLARFSLLTILYNLAVILWGAWVRASGSGAGCGAHWPLCGDNIIPQSPTVHMLTELAHRLSSTIALLMVVWMIVLARKHFPVGHPARKWAWTSLGFIFAEALIGAGLVLFQYVAQNDSLGRAFWLGAHLLNTMLMLASFWLTRWSAQERHIPSFAEIRKRQPWIPLALIMLLITGMAGVVASLSSTLFPSDTLAHGVSQDFSATAHLLVRLRVFHPVVAIFTGLIWLLFARRAAGSDDSDESIRNAAQFVMILVGIQWSIGAATLILNVPVAAQLMHLLTADVLWLTCVNFTLTALSAQSERTMPASNLAASLSNTRPAPLSR